MKWLLMLVLACGADTGHAQDATKYYVVTIPNTAMRFRPYIKAALAQPMRPIQVVFAPGNYHIIRHMDLRGVQRMDAYGAYFWFEVPGEHNLFCPGAKLCGAIAGPYSVNGGYFE